MIGFSDRTRTKSSHDFSTVFQYLIASVYEAGSRRAFEGLKYFERLSVKLILRHENGDAEDHLKAFRACLESSLGPCVRHDISSGRPGDVRIWSEFRLLEHAARQVNSDAMEPPTPCPAGLEKDEAGDYT